MQAVAKAGNQGQRSTRCAVTPGIRISRGAARAARSLTSHHPWQSSPTLSIPQLKGQHLPAHRAVSHGSEKPTKTSNGREQLSCTTCQRANEVARPRPTHQSHRDVQDPCTPVAEDVSIRRLVPAQSTESPALRAGSPSQVGLLPRRTGQADRSTSREWRGEERQGKTRGRAAR
jgi:hypothetical protein